MLFILCWDHQTFVLCCCKQVLQHFFYLTATTKETDFFLLFLRLSNDRMFLGKKKLTAL